MKTGAAMVSIVRTMIPRQISRMSTAKNGKITCRLLNSLLRTLLMINSQFSRKVIDLPQCLKTKKVNIVTFNLLHK